MVRYSVKVTRGHQDQEIRLLVLTCLGPAVFLGGIQVFFFCRWR